VPFGFVLVRVRVRVRVQGTGAVPDNKITPRIAVFFTVRVLRPSR